MLPGEPLRPEARKAHGSSTIEVAGDDLGSIDYVVVEFPSGHTNFPPELARELTALVESGTVRVLDVLIVHKDVDGAIDAFEIDDLDVVEELRGFEDEIADILSAKDVVHIAAAMVSGSTAGVIVWENRWAAPFGAAARRAGGQLIANGHIPINAILASFEADDDNNRQTDADEI